MTPFSASTASYLPGSSNLCTHCSGHGSALPAEYEGRERRTSTVSELDMLASGFSGPDSAPLAGAGGGAVGVTSPCAFEAAAAEPVEALSNTTAVSAITPPAFLTARIAFRMFLRWIFKVTPS